VASNDAALEELIVHLSSLNLLDDTLIVFIADHGEHLGEHGLWDHIPPSYMQVIHVPMLMRLPSAMARTAVVEQPVQLMDLMPTLLELAEIEVADLPLHGRSLVPLFSTQEPATVPEIAVIQEAMRYKRPDDTRIMGSLVWGRWHYLHSDKVPFALFDHLVDLGEDDPLPTKTVGDEAARLLAELRRLDDELRQSVVGEEVPVVEVDLDNIANLEALGYLDH
jgi:iduronate 2-sulfatase